MSALWHYRAIVEHGIPKRRGRVINNYFIREFHGSEEHATAVTEAFVDAAKAARPLSGDSLRVAYCVRGPIPPAVLAEEEGYRRYAAAPQT